MVFPRRFVNKPGCLRLCGGPGDGRQVRVDFQDLRSHIAIAVCVGPNFIQDLNVPASLDARFTVATYHLVKYRWDKYEDGRIFFRYEFAY